MIVVVADTSPLHYLIQVQAIGVLPHFFDEVVIPKSVERELLNPSTPHEVREWMLHPPGWATIKSAVRILPLNLDPGETEAIALAKELAAFAVLLDDGEARQAAKRGGLQVTGTIGILENAAAAGLVDLPSVFGRLKATTYYVSPELLEAALARDLARKQEKP